MEAITSTEKLIANFNKFSNGDRNPENLSSAVKSTIDLFTRQISKGKVPEDAINDFTEMVTMYKYTDTPQVSNDLTEYYSNSIAQSINYVQDIQNVDEISKKVA